MTLIVITPAGPECRLLALPRRKRLVSFGGYELTFLGYWKVKE
jgi:hypothetical protein